MGKRRAQEGHERTGSCTTINLVIAEVTYWGREKIPELEAFQGKGNTILIHTFAGPPLD